jgi:hypothetical protein
VLVAAGDRDAGLREDGEWRCVACEIALVFDKKIIREFGLTGWRSRSVKFGLGQKIILPSNNPTYLAWEIFPLKIYVLTLVLHACIKIVILARIAIIHARLLFAQKKKLIIVQYDVLVPL